ncbi:MAG TPA: purine-nucleoside phosphorylase [Polyangiaceae bacterium]|nr:purine-nucleoside phosphorylase [Polyangiaceae bacterium]
MSIHIAALPGDIAPTVLLPGDPLRAKFLAERYLTDVRCHNEVRNMLGYTGTRDGKRVSVQGTGMGAPSFSIYVNELLRDHRASTLIRVGTCGAIQPRIGLRDVILATGASTSSGMNRHRFQGMDFAPTADFHLLRAAHDAAERKGVRVHAGPVLSSDFFYDDPADWQRWAAYGVLAIEMECAELYTLAARFGARALAVLTVSDHIVDGGHTTAQERETSFTRMAEIALEVATSFA